MQKWPFAAIAVLLVLLGVQTIRLNRTEQLYTNARAELAKPRPADGASATSSHVDAKADSQTIAQPTPQSESDRPVTPTLQRTVPVKVHFGSEKERILAQVQLTLDQGNTPEAETLLKEAIEKDPDNARFYRVKLAEIYQNAGRTSEQLEVFKKWLREAPNDPEPHLRLANVYNQMGERDKALEEIAQYEQLNPEDASLLSTAATLYRGMGMEAEERVALEAWVAASPGSLEAHRALGEYYRRTHDDDAALFEYQQAAQQFPGNADMRLELAHAYERTGDEDNMRAELDAALGLRPGDPRILMPLGDSYRRSGDIESALEIYQSVIETNPGTREAERAARNIEHINDPPPPKPKPPAQPKKG